MYPIYRHMDSYPQQRPYSPYHPNFESIPYQMKPELAKSHSPYESWPNGGNNYCYPYPVEFHSRCNHNYFPGCYTFRSPYPHFPPPPQPFHCHGSYYPSHPHFPMEMPSRYEYDKNTTPDYHCCGCPNHSHTRNEDQNVKIEEPDPDAEKKIRDCLVPRQLKNYPHPIVWIPPGYFKNKEDGKEKPIELESKDKERDGNSKSFEQEPSFWNGWLPLDMMERGDWGEVQHQKNDEDGRLPFPIFEMPYKPKALERNGLGEYNHGEEYDNKLPSHFSITPVDVSDTEDSKNKSLPSGREADSDSIRNTSPEKIENDGKKKTEKEREVKARSIPVEFRTDNEKRNPSKNSERKRSSSSPPKSSKLPPVCLRVDPLPGRKSRSRSPSPPAIKGKSEKSNSKSFKSFNLSNMKENRQENIQPPEHVDKSKEVEQSNSKTKTIEVVENDIKNRKYGSKELTEAKNEILGQSSGGKCEIGESKGEIDTIKERGNIDEAKKAGRNLSDDEAAVIIQSAYRGFEVRKWEPLIKLKLIAKVKEQASAIKSSFQVLESSSDVQSDDKQRLVLGETIMSLLLKLDTIQGLHPSIRDFRKSVARELVGLQEKLDSLATKKLEGSIDEAFAAKQMKDLSSSTTIGTEKAVENFEPMVVDKQICGVLESKGTDSPVANDEENVEEHKDKLLDIDNGENLEFKPCFDELTHQLVTKDNACSEELPKEMPITAEPEGELGPESKGKNDEKLLGEAGDGQQEHSADAQGEEVNEDNNRKAEEEPLKDEATNANGVALALEVEEPKSELPRVDEENDEKVHKEAKHEEEVQLEKAHQEKFNETNYPQSMVEEIIEKPDKFTVQSLKDEVNNANDIVQTIKAEKSELDPTCVEGDEKVRVVEVKELQPKLPCVEGDDIIQAIKANQPQPELPCVEGNDIVQAVEAEVPQPALPCVEGDDIVLQGVEAEVPQLELLCVEGNDIVQAIEAKEPHSELPCAELEPFASELTGTGVTKEAILVDGDKEVLNGDQEIEQRNGTAEEFVPQGNEELMVETERKLKEENEKLREMVEKLVEAGREQLSAISNLSGKVKDLEKKLSTKKKLKMRKCAKRSRTYEDQIVF
ncbi:hypothetical protein LguiB_010802 [Lonicera macranthoides]